MQRVLTVMGRLVRRDEGQDLVEYGLLAVLIAAAAVISVTAVGERIYTVLWQGIATAPF